MNTGAKIALLAGASLFAGGVVALWAVFGADVYLAYMGDLIMRCF